MRCPSFYATISRASCASCSTAVKHLRSEGSPTVPAATLLVLAPPEIHTGIHQLIRDLDGLADPPAAPAPFKLTYWVVAGRTLRADAASDGPYRITGSRRVQPIEPVLMELADLDGPSEFTLLERLELTSSGTRWATANGRATEIRQRTTRVPGRRDRRDSHGNRQKRRGDRGATGAR